MTENEVIEQLEIFPEWNREDRWLDVGDMEELVNFCIKTLEEIQQYRAIGTVERFQQLAEQFKPYTTDKTSCPERHCNKCDKYRKENEKYHEIGTVEECQEAMERQREKKPNLVTPCKSVNCYRCPICGELVSMNESFCNNCGFVLEGMKIYKDTDQ